MKKIFCIVMLISLVFNQNTYAKPKNNKEIKDKPGTAIFVMALNQPLNVAIIPQKINFTSDEITVTMDIPQIKGLSDKNFEKEINKKILCEAKKLKKESIKTAKDYNKDLTTYNLTPIKFELISKYNEIKSINPFFVIGIFEYTYAGGAHGLGIQKYLTIDTKQNKIIQLKDLFKEGIDYKKLINEKITYQMAERKQKGEFFFEGPQGFMGISDNQQFYVNKNGDIVLVFNVYEIAPYGAGVIEFTIPKEELGNSTNIIY